MRQYQGRLVEFARKNRRAPTKAEKLLWAQVRGSQPGGLRFRRQQPVGRFIVDFFCAEAKLVIEVDGETHFLKHEYDRTRADWLKSRGFELLFFSDEQVLRDPRACWIRVLQVAFARTPRLADRIQELPTW